MTEDQSETEKGLIEALQRSEASLLPAIEKHVSNDQFNASHGLDFLDVKNSLLLTYLIELTHNLRQRLMNEEPSESSFERLQLMKTVIDKSRGLDKKLKYQIDKLLAAGSTASTIASGSGNVEEDPLQVRPDLNAMEEEKDGANDEDVGSSDDDVSDGGDEGFDDEDGDLAAARMTVAKSRDGKKIKKKARDDDDDDDDAVQGDDGVYRAPRLTSVPYTHDKRDVEAERERRQRRKIRASELAQTLRAQYGEAPEQEDTRGGAELGQQREASRRMAEREKEKSRYEEDNMVRLVASRKEKKERKRMLRENSNLAAIADLGNLIRESQFGVEKQSKGEEYEDVFATKRHANGKRKKSMIDADGKLLSMKPRKSVEAKNSLQAALFGGASAGGKKGKKRRTKS